MNPRCVICSIRADPPASNTAEQGGLLVASVMAKIAAARRVGQNVPSPFCAWHARKIIEAADVDDNGRPKR